jgi:cysteine desulfurase
VDAQSLYFDNNATTFVAPEALASMLPYLQTSCGNPSSGHALGNDAADALALARSSVARLIGARSPREILFTSGGTECIHSAIHAARARNPKLRRIVTSQVEHPAVLEPLEQLEGDSGFEIVRVAVNSNGELDVEQALQAIDENCALVSLQWVNNEIGVITSKDTLRAVGNRCREQGASFHVDAMQATGKLVMNVSELPLDMVSISAHKFHGPKGCGMLWVHGEFPFQALFRGGPQELDRRAGTENVPAIAGAGRAADLAREFAADDSGQLKLTALRNDLEQRIRAALPDTHIHGGSANRVGSTASFGFPGISGEAAVALLAEYGLAVSTGSACSSGRRGVSHVLAAMDVEESVALGTLRFSLSRYTTPEAVAEAASLTVTAVEQLRALSPLVDSGVNKPN